MSQWRERLRRIYRLCKARDRRSPNKRQRNLLLETFGRHLFQTTVFLLAIGSVGILWGTRIRPATAQPSLVHELNNTSSASDRGSELSSERRSANASASLPSPVVPQTRAGENSIRTFTYVIQPTDTLQDLCMSTLGRYDSKVLSQIRELNPGLKNLDHLHVGQEIRLPML